MTLLDYFEKLDLAIVNAYVCDGRQEDLHLDFKLVSNADLSSRDDRKNLACAIAGFANSAGGIIVWGINCRKDDDGVDCAGGPAEISPLAKFMTRLEELSPTGASPPVDGIRHKKIESAKDSGFAITYVPESAVGPHMAKLGENRFYKRSGSTFRQMEQFDIADMFGRRMRPDLRILATHVETDGDREILIRIRNVGRASARAPFLAIIPPAPYNLCVYGLDGNRNNGLAKIVSAHSETLFGEGSAFTIHPGVTLDVTRLKAQRAHLHLAKQPLKLGFRIAALDLSIREGVIEIDGTTSSESEG